MGLFGERGFTKRVGSLLKPYPIDWQTLSWAEKTRVFYFDKLPVEDGKKVLEELPVLKEDKQNFSPVARELIALAEKFGGSLIGYWVREPREDERVSFVGFYVPKERGLEALADIKALMREDEEVHRPDESWAVGDLWRFWWD